MYSSVQTLLYAFVFRHNIDGRKMHWINNYALSDSINIIAKLQ